MRFSFLSQWQWLFWFGAILFLFIFVLWFTAFRSTWLFSGGQAWWENAYRATNLIGSSVCVVSWNQYSRVVVNIKHWTMAIISECRFVSFLAPLFLRDAVVGSSSWKRGGMRWRSLDSLCRAGTINYVLFRKSGDSFFPGVMHGIHHVHALGTLLW